MTRALGVHHHEGFVYVSISEIDDDMKPTEVLACVSLDPETALVFSQNNTKAAWAAEEWRKRDE